MRVEGPQDADLAQIVTESQNVSASGVYCTSSHYLAPLSKVGLTLVLPKIPGSEGNELVKCEGIVVRCDPVAKRSERSWELACMFSDLDGTRREMIEDFVTWRNLQALRAATRPSPKKAAARKTGTTRRATASRKRTASTPARKTARKRVAARSASRATTARKTGGRRSA
jgi:hypothetical protein